MGTLISVTLTIAIAYPLSRRDFFGRNILTRVIVFTMLFAIPHAIGVWQVIIARTYFRYSIPEELHEAAEIDGVSGLREATQHTIIPNPTRCVAAGQRRTGVLSLYTRDDLETRTTQQHRREPAPDHTPADPLFRSN